MPRYDLPNPAPEPLRLVQQFVNSVDLQHEREWLPTARALESWFAEHSLHLGESLNDADLRRAVELREALRALLRAGNGGRLEPEAVATVNHAARAGAVQAGLEPDGGLAIRPSGSGVDAALGRILAVAFEAMLDGPWSRLKACRQCSWAFYDYSKNRSGRWCSMAICGNRRKTRSYRDRRAERHGQQA